MGMGVNVTAQAFWTAAMAASALERMALELTVICTKLELALGIVFLKRSRASSSLRTF